MMRMEFKPFSKKQLALLCWWTPDSPYKDLDAIICDGAVRSGKTLCMSLSFVFWAFSAFNGASFALCGKTVTSLKRNIILPLCEQLRELGFCCEIKASQNCMTVARGAFSNRFYFFGGRDESSAALIQGMTLSGALLDEVALMPRSFVEQTVARCSVDGSKFWFNCNPEHPQHWFYRNWILMAKQKKALYLHFTMKDNPSLSPEIRKRYETLYSGTFYERFVLGKWVAADGLIYPMFSAEKFVRNVGGTFDRYFISCDYRTVNPMSMGLWGVRGNRAHRISEYYYSGKETGEQKTDEEYYVQLEKLAGERDVSAVICDPSAASFMTCVRRHGRFKVIPAKNAVNEGINLVADALREGRLSFSPSCTDTVREFGLYRWDESSVRDRPVKENDHAMDDIRYFVSTVLTGEKDGFIALSVDR